MRLWGRRKPRDTTPVAPVPVKPEPFDIDPERLDPWLRHLSSLESPPLIEDMEPGTPFVAVSYAGGVRSHLGWVYIGGGQVRVQISGRVLAASDIDQATVRNVGGVRR